VKIKMSALVCLFLLFQACTPEIGKGTVIANEYFKPHLNDYISVSPSSGTSTNNLKKGFYHYQKEEYQLALDNFKKSNTVGNPRLKLYMAVAHIGLQNHLQAEQILEGLIIVNRFEYTDVAYWYLALTYLRQEKISAAEAIFQAFATREDGSYRQAESAVILKKFEEEE